MEDGQGSELVGGRYRIIRELGRGGAAVVYVAADIKLAGLVAVKALHSELSESRVAERFRREIRLMAHFGHAHILPVLDSGQWGERLFYVMKYVEGSETLRDRLGRQSSGLPVDNVLRIAHGVCHALAYAHSEGVLHRDVKPENILLSGTHAFLTDFGVAKALTTAPGDTNTSSGYALGTQRYMSPEQECADPQLDARTDVWSLGCVIFESLSGMHPFHSPDASRMRSMKVSDPPEALRRHRPQAPRWLELAIEKALQPNPSDRWQSVQEFATALTRGLDAGELSGGRAAFEGMEHRGVQSTSGTRPLALRQVITPTGTGELQVSSASDVARSPVLRAAAGILLAVAVLAVGVWAMRGARAGAAALEAPVDPSVIAVNLVAATAQPQLRDVAERLNAEVVRELARIPAFRVVSVTQMRACQEQPTSACNAMLTAQRVGTRLEGSIERAGDSLVLVAHIGDEASGTALQSLTVSVPGSADAATVERLAARLTMTLRRRLGASGARAAQLLPGASEGSTTLLRAVMRERADAESLAALPGVLEQQSAIGALQRADSLLGALIATNRTSSSLWIERGWVALAIAQRDAGSRAQSLRLASTYAESAFVRAPASANAFELRGHVRLALAQAMEESLASSSRLECEAEGDLRRALAADERLYRSWSALSRLLWSAGRTSEAKLAVTHATRHDAYLDHVRTSLVNTFFAQLFLENYSEARKACLSGHDLWPDDYKFVECQLTLMLYDTRGDQDPVVAKRLATMVNRLDTREKAQAAGNEYRAIFRDVVVAIVATRRGDAAFGRGVLARVRSQIAASPSTSLRYDFSPQEATLLWELGDAGAARAVLVDWLRHRTDEIPNFRQNPMWRRMGLRDSVLRESRLPLTSAPACLSA